ncbi:hypothetical protein CHUAL_000641 [Chamberlinius hualienensis]
MEKSGVLDISLCEQIATSIEKITVSGKQELDQDLMKNIKVACKKSDDYINHTYRLLMHQLEEDHSEIRFSTVLICDELFRRSHRFRELLVSEFQSFLELTVGCNNDEELPPPKAVAVKLKRKTLECIGQWHSKFGDGYKKLRLGYNFLKDCKQINFNDISDRSLAQQAAEREANQRQEIINNEKLSQLQLEIKELLPEINSCVEKMRVCIQILRSSDVFQDIDFDNPQPCCSKDLPKDSDKCGEMDDLVRDHGLGNPRYSLTVEVKLDTKPLEVTNDNTTVIQTLQEHKHLVEIRYQSAVAKWIQIAIKCSKSSAELKTAIDAKNSLEEILKKCKEAGIPDKIIAEDKLNSSSDDEDFEEVETKEGFQPVIPVHERKLYGLSPLPADTDVATKQKVTAKNWKVVNNEESVASDPTSYQYHSRKLEQMAREKGLLQLTIDKSEPTSKPDTLMDPLKKDLYARAPKIRLVEISELQMDTASVTLKQDMGHRFWSNQASSSETKLKAQKLGRVLEIDASCSAIKWSCRAPLPSGKLCPRSDRIKCPFHGKIVARDEMGNPSREEDRMMLQTLLEKQQQENPDWQDPTLLKEIQAATGIDLTIKKRSNGKDKKKSKKKRKFPELSDINEVKSTARARLEKKVFNSASVKRVARVLDSQDLKKFDDKFGNQFNYSSQN